MLLPNFDGGNCIIEMTQSVFKAFWYSMLRLHASGFQAVTGKTVVDQHAYDRFLAWYLWLCRGVIAGRPLSRQADLLG